jgi:hypothetical protein
MVEEGVLSCAAMQLAAVVIHRTLAGRVCYPMHLQARCCCDSQNALVEEGCYPCAAMQARCCCDPQNALVEGVCYPCAAMQLAAVVIHRMLVQGRCAIPALYAQLLL